MVVKTALLCAGIVVCSIMGVDRAYAQSTGGTGPFSQNGQVIGLQSVATRPNPEYDPLGVPLGVWTLYPSLTTQTTYNDNVYEISKGESDVYLLIQPRLALKDNASNYSVGVLATGSFSRYKKLTTEDSNLYSFSANGLYDISSDTTINGLASYSRQVEPRGTAGDTIIGGSPITYRLASGSLGLNQGAGRFFFNLQASVSKYSYEDVHDQGQDIPQSNRDLAVYSTNGKISYALDSTIALYASVAYTKQEYSSNPIIDRNGESVSAVGGVQFSITSLLTGHAGIGYIKVYFDSPEFGGASGLDYDVALQWNPTQLISFSLVGTRSLSRSPVENAGGLIESGFTLTTDYELLRNIILSGSVGQNRDSYQGASITNTRWNERLSVQYKISRLIAVTLSGTSVQEHSRSSEGRDYSGNTCSLGLLMHI